MSDVRQKMTAMLTGEATEFNVPAFEEAFPGALDGASKVLTTTIYTGSVKEVRGGVTREFRFTRKGDQVFVACYGRLVYHYSPGPATSA